MEGGCEAQGDADNEAKGVQGRGRGGARRMVWGDAEFMTMSLMGMLGCKSSLCLLQCARNYDGAYCAHDVLELIGTSSKGATPWLRRLVKMTCGNSET